MFKIWVIYRCYFVNMLKSYINGLNNVQQPKTIYIRPDISIGSNRKTVVKKRTGDRMEVRNMREIRGYVEEIRGIMPQKRAETVIRRLIVLKTMENLNPFLKKDIDYLIRVVNDPDSEHRNVVCDIVEHTINNIKKGRY